MLPENGLHRAVMNALDITMNMMSLGGLAAMNLSSMWTNSLQMLF